MPDPAHDRTVSGDSDIGCLGAPGRRLLILLVLFIVDAPDWVAGCIGHYVT